MLTNAVFAGTQFLIGVRVSRWQRTCKPALALSVVWALAVWWFGEGLGGLFTGAGTPLGEGRGAVLLCRAGRALVANPGRNMPFVAARTLGERVARALWAAVWMVLAVLAVAGEGRSPRALHDLVATVATGQPGWLLRIDRWSETVLLHDGTVIAVLFALFCALVAVSVYLHPTVTQVVLVVAMVAFAVVWAAVQDFGGDLAGGATDLGSGLLVLLFILIYWPLTPAQGDEVAADHGLAAARPAGKG